MKNIRLMSLATMLIALFMSAGAFAQDVNLSVVDKYYLQPGDTAKIAVKIDSKVAFGTLTTKIKLPEGLSFVKLGEADKNGAFNFAFSTDSITNKGPVTVLFGGVNDSEASLTVNKSNDFKAGKGNFISFDVAVTKNFVATAGDITFDDVNAYRYDVATDDMNTWKQDGFAVKVYNEAELFTPSLASFTIKAGETKSVGFNFKYTKDVAGMSFYVELPEGLTIDEDSYVMSTDRIPNHTYGIRPDGKVLIYPNGKSPEYNFIGTEGTLFTFDLTADKNFKEGDIKFYNLEANSESIDGKMQFYYAKDFSVHVKEGVETGINGIEKIGEGAADGIYQLNGVRTDKMQRGVNIVVKDGKAIKVVKK